jgi:hypothetical protein
MSSLLPGEHTRRLESEEVGGSPESLIGLPSLREKSESREDGRQVALASEGAVVPA